MGARNTGWVLGYRLGVGYTARVLIYRLGARIQVGTRIQVGARIEGGR